MNDVFLLIMNNVEITSVILVAIMLIRLIFKKIPKMIYPILWGVAGIKLLIPFDIYSSVGVLSSEKNIEPVSVGNAPIIVRTGVTSVDEGVNHYIGSVYQETNISTNHGLEWMDILAMIWVAGMVCMLGYFLISYLLMRRKVSQSIIIESGVSICDEINSPFLMGIVRPHIYIPSGLDRTKYEYVLAHERMHKKRGDALWKIVAFMSVSIYWFNPLCWISYLLFCKDVELACDESVIKNREPSWRSDYCQALLECNNGSRKVAFIPVAFGEVGVKQRVKNVLRYKKTKPIIVVLVMILCVGIFVCLGTKHMAKPLVQYQMDRNELVLGIDDEYVLSFNAEDKSLDRGSDADLDDELNGVNQKLSWSSTDESVAEVDDKGVVKAKNTGETVIKARRYLRTYECKVIVVAKDSSIDNYINYNNDIFGKNIYDNIENVSLHFYKDIEYKDAYHIGKVYSMLAAMGNLKFEEDVTKIYSNDWTMPIGDEVIMINLKNGESIWVRGTGENHFVLVKDGKSLKYSYTYSDRRFGTNFDLFQSLRTNIANGDEEMSLQN